MQPPNRLGVADLKTGDPLNGIVIKFLETRKGSGRSSGRGCAGDILRWAQKNRIFIDGRRPILWLNYRIRDAILISNNDHQSPFGMKEIEGMGQGINFEWWVK